VVDARVIKSVTKLVAVVEAEGMVVKLISALVIVELEDMLEGGAIREQDGESQGYQNKTYEIKLTQDRPHEVPDEVTGVCKCFPCTSPSCDLSASLVLLSLHSQLLYSPTSNSSTSQPPISKSR
jgi:ferredoxin-fold anticodon binding domain-containing protein